MHPNTENPDTKFVKQKPHKDTWIEPYQTADVNDFKMDIFRQLPIDMQELVFKNLNAGTSYEGYTFETNQVAIDGWEFWCRGSEQDVEEINAVLDSGLVEKVVVTCSYAMDYITTELRDLEVNWLTSSFPVNKTVLQYDGDYFNDIFLCG